MSSTASMLFYYGNYAVKAQRKADRRIYRECVKTMAQRLIAGDYP